MYNLIKVIVLAVLVAFTTAAALAQPSPIGVWKTVDDKSGEAKSHVEIYQQQGKLYGKIIKVLKKDAAEICEECPGKKKNQKIVGLVIIEDLEAVKEYWKNGTILDPENGNVYGLSIWFEAGKPDELKVRGKHWSGLYRTQTWYRVK